LSLLPLFAFYLNIPPKDVDELVIDDFEYLAGWIDAHEARLKAAATTE
jgi:hypothetical protein